MDQGGIKAYWKKIPKNLVVFENFPNFASKIKFNIQKLNLYCMSKSRAITISDYSTKYLNRENDTLNSYLKDVRKYNVPTSEEMDELFEKYKKGGIKERNEIIVRNQRFIISIAKRFAKNDDEMPDYINEGNIGLIAAFDKFNPDEGVKFLTYAVWYIRRQMNNYLHNKLQPVTRSNNMKFMGKIEKFKEKFFSENGYYPTNEDIVEGMKSEYDIDVNDVRDIMDVNIVSINKTVTDDLTVEDDSEFVKATASQNTVVDKIEEEDAINKVNGILSVIPEKMSTLLKKLYGIGYDREYTEQELANDCGLEIEDFRDYVKKIMCYVKQESNYVAA